MLPRELIVQCLDVMNIGMTFINEKAQITYFNSYADEMFGYREKGLCGRPFMECHTPEIHEIVRIKLDNLKTGSSGERHRTIERGGRFLENYYSPVIIKGEYRGTVIASTDVTERKLLSRALEKTIQELTVFFEAVQLVNSSLNVAEVLKSIINLAGPSIGFDGGGILLSDRVTGETVHKTLYNYPEERLSQINCSAWSEKPNFLKMPVEVNAEISGLWFVEKFCGQAFSPDQKEMLTALAGLTGTAVKNAWLFEKTRYQAITDILTGLYNRQYFDHIFGIEKERVSSSRKPLSLIMIDVNRLKFINDHFGHETGDFIIREAAAIVKDCLRKEELVFRYGGDEMVILLPGSVTRVVKSVVDRIVGKIEKWNSYNGKGDIYLSLSIGWATADREMELATLLKNADDAMYRDKEAFYISLREMEYSKNIKTGR